MTLSKRDRNRIYRVIEEGRLNPAEFEFMDAGERAILTHSSGSTFEFSIEPGTRNRHEYRFRVAEGIDEDGAASSIDTLTILQLPKWLGEIQETVGVPDFWEELRRGRQLLTEFQQESGNTPFTDDEQKQIAVRLREIKAEIGEQFELTSEQIAQVNEKLDEAAEASKYMGRKDWLIYFLGTITALIITATVAAGVGEHIFTTVIQGIAHLFTGGTGPPPIPPKIIS
jgi:hypothetical protein